MGCGFFDTVEKEYDDFVVGWLGLLRGVSY